MRPSAPALLTLTLIVLIYTAAEGSSPVIRGIPKSSYPLYTRTRDTFTCLDRSQTIPHSRINDDYCDCADGSDEPGTAACANGRFYCINKGFRGRYIPSSRVNDGVCDCCDGTDENNGATVCSDTCKELGAESAKEAVKKAEIAREGARIRQEWVEQARKLTQEHLAELERLRAEEKGLKEALNDAAAEKERWEEVERSEQEAITAQWEAEHAEIKEAETVSAPVEVDEMKEAEEDGDLDETTNQEEGSESPPKHTNEDAEKARKIHNDAKQSHSDLTNKIKALEAKAYMDYGGDQEFLPLQGQCFELKVNKYTYELCPFDKVTQSEGGGKTTLGKWKDWKEGAAYSAQVYDSGEKCWQGPDRSTMVEIVCGATSEVQKVDEPSRCEYTMVFATPAACSQLHADILQLNLESEGDTHDVELEEGMAMEYEERV